MIFLFGHKGFVGSGISSFLTQQNISFVGIDRENYDAYKGKSCDIFINAGGNSAKRLAAQNPQADFQKNVLDTFATLQDFLCKKYVYLSTIDVYRDVSDQKKSEESMAGFLVNSENKSVLSNYGFHKLLAEQLVKQYASNFLILRLGGMVGPNLKKNAVFDILHNQLFVNPLSEYQYIHTFDVARIILELSKTEAKVVNETINLCGDGTVSPAEIADHLTVPIQENWKKNKQEKYEININKLKSFIDVPKTKKTVFDFVDAYSKKDD